MGFQGVASGMANAVDQKTPQQMNRHQGAEHQGQTRPMTGVANQNSHSAQSSHKMGSGAAKADGQAANNSSSGAQIAGADKGQSA